LLLLRSEPWLLFQVRRRRFFLSGQRIYDNLLELRRAAFERAAQVRLTMREAPANRVRVIRLSTGELEPGAIRVAEGNVILPVLIDKNDQRQLGGETFQELRRVLELLRFAVARQIDGQFLEGRFSLQVFDCGENNGRLV